MSTPLGHDRGIRRAIATVCLSGMLEDKLDAVAGAGFDGRVSAVFCYAGECGVGGVVFRLEKFWRGRVGSARGEGGGCDVDARERVAGGEEWEPTRFLMGWRVY